LNDDRPPSSGAEDDLSEALRPPDQTTGVTPADSLDAPSQLGGVPPNEVDDPVAARDPYNRGGEFRSTGLRRHAARGVLINSAFQVAMITLNFVQRLAVAALLTLEEFGLWGLIATTLITLSWLKEIGIKDKYIQQDEGDQVEAYQKAFTFELFYSLAWYALCVIALPIYGVAYGHTEIIVPGLILALMLPLSAFMSPIWILYRQMRYGRQRALLAIGPVIGTIVTIGLAASGAGFWSLVIGQLAGTLSGAVAALLAAPFPLRLRFDRSALRDYFSFSWPLFLNGLAGLIVVQGAVITGNYTVGLAGIAAIGLATNFAQFTGKVDAVLQQTMYPAVAAVKTRMDLLFEAFVKSNRLAMMWGVPFGFGLSLFAGDVVTYLLGEKWRIAEPLLVAFGIILGLSQIAFNWTMFMRVLNNTRPIAVEAFLRLAVFAAITAPLMIVAGLDGYVAGMATSAAVELAYRGYYMSRLFGDFRFFRHAIRGIAPTLPAIGAVLVIRTIETGERTAEIVLGELALYGILIAAATWLLERELVAEMVGYLRRARGRRPAAETAVAG
jgi:O-antigen/teichoic acid export membrane protein